MASATDSTALSAGVSSLSLTRNAAAPRVPRAGERNVLVTSALPYVNNYPHLGNLIGAVLSADVYARFLRQRSVNVLFVCGTDEYGTTSETKAQQENVTPREICDKYHALHRGVYDWFDIEFDEFGRTSTPAQTRIVQEIFWDVHNAGYIAEDTMTQLYCDATCHRFLADRYVNGTCPSCGYEDARGDQCDNCGRMLNTTELVLPKCATCGCPPITRDTKHLFLDLPKIQPDLKAWVARASEKGAWSANSVVLTNTWLRDGLKKRCITRDLSWGVPVPLDGYTDKVFYVWFDAPIGYLSITAGYGDRCGDRDLWRKWWNPDHASGVDVDLVQFMGKDNTPFHTIVFPSTLLATQKSWTMLHHISTTDYLNYEDGKFSKSRGVGVFGNDAQDTEISPEVWRYYLLLNRPEGADSAFTWSDLAAKNNDELLKNLGNFINRTVTFMAKFFDSVVPNLLSKDPVDAEFVTRINVELAQYVTLMESVSLKASLKKAMAVSAIGNLYLQTKQPWLLLKQGDNAAAGSSVTFAANLVALVCTMLEPFLGSKFSAKVYSQLGLVHSPGVNNIIPETFDPTEWVTAGSRTGAPTILFPALSDDRVSELRARFAGGQASADISTAAAAEPAAPDPGNVFSLILRVGKIMEIADHAESERLFVGKVDVGEEVGPRTFVAGLRDCYTADELRNKRVVVVCNLAPATLAGIESQGMILCADKKKVLKVLSVDESLAVGEILAPVGLAMSESRVPLDRSGFQAASKLLRVGKGGMITYNKSHVLAAVSNSDAVVTSSGVADGGKVK
jgi:methionyl-tRNA synthetase